MTSFDEKFASRLAEKVSRHKWDNASSKLVPTDKEKPLKGKEKELLTALRKAEHEHNQALLFDKYSEEPTPQEAALTNNKLKAALKALDETKFDLALIDEDLDHRDTEPNSDRDLRGLLRRAIEVIDAFVNSDVHRSRASSRALRNHPDRVRSVGLQEFVNELNDFWLSEIGTDFKAEFVTVFVKTEYSPKSDGESDPDLDKGNLVPTSPAAVLVLTVAQCIDGNYSGAHCENAMRSR